MKNQFLLLLSIFFFCHFGFSQFSAGEIIARDIPDCDDMEFFDLDQDGDEDLICNTKFNQMILWYEKNNAGTFGVRDTLLFLDYSIQDMMIADYDNDGKPDFAFVARSGELELYKNNGNLDFQLAFAQPVSASTYEKNILQFADIDGDGVKDLIVSRGNYGKWFRNLGNFNFALQTINFYGESVLAIDVNNDGHNDILTTNFNQLTVRINNGSGIFPTNLTTSYGSSSSSETDVEILAHDCDLDGDLDIFLLYNDNGVIRIWKNNGTGQFSTGTQLFSSGSSPIALLNIVDQDNDGIKDVLFRRKISYNTTNNIMFMKGAADGTYLAPTILFANSKFVNVLQFPDINNDGIKDMLIYDRREYAYSEEIKLFTGNNTPVPFQDFTSIDQFHGLAQYDKIKFADIDQDSKPDMYTPPFLYMNTGIPSLLSSMDSVGFTYDNFILKDLNNDQYPDLIGYRDADIGPYELRWSKNVQGHYDTSHSLVVDYAFKDVQTGDIDQDSDEDIFYVTNNSVFKIVNSGSNTFGTSQGFFSSNTTIDKFILNDCSQTEGSVLYAVLRNASVLVAFGNGGGYFEFQNLSGISQMSIWDIDGDGLDDISCLSGSQFIWYKNNPDHTFTNQGPIRDEITMLFRYQLADFDLDGHDDLVFEGEVNSLWGIYTMRKDGVGHFAAPEFVNEASLSDVTDFDSDGYPDILYRYSNGWAMQVFWSKNNSDGPPPTDCSDLIELSVSQGNCENDAYTIINTTFAADQHQWFVNGNLVSTTPILSYSAQGSDDNIQLISSASTCPDADTSFVLHFNENPVPDLNQPDTIFNCAQVPVSLTSNYSDNNHWSDINGDLSGNSSIAVSQTGFYYLQVEENGCIGRDSVYLSSDYSSPVPDLGLADTVFNCTQVAIMLNSNYGSNNTWFDHTGNISSDPGIIVSETGFYYLQVEENGCVGLDSVYLSSDYTDPQIHINHGTTLNLCHGSIVLTSDHPSNNTWYFNSQITSHAQSITADIPGHYVLNVSVGGCVGTDNVNIVNDIPVALILIQNDTIFAYPDPQNSYEWIDCSTMNVLSAGSDPFYVPQSDGSFMASITNADNCEVETSCVAFDYVGVKEIAAEATVKLYPNPAKTDLVIETGMHFDKIELTDLNGKKMRDILPGDQTKVMLDVREFSSGVYFVHFISAENNFTRRIAVEN